MSRWPARQGVRRGGCDVCPGRAVRMPIMRPSWKWMSFLPAIGWAILLSSCANSPNGRGWGQDATISPGWARIGASARAALLSTQTWLPAAGALALQIDNADQRLANWGARHTPVFGSRNGAERGSDDLRAATRYAHLVTVLVTPSGEEPGEAALAKSKGLAVGAAAVFSADRLTTGLKQSTNRERPDDSDDQKLPPAILPMRPPTPPWPRAIWNRYPCHNRLELLRSLG